MTNADMHSLVIASDNRDPDPARVPRLLESRKRDGDSITAVVCSSDSGARWVRIERTARDGRQCAVNLPLRIAGSLGNALVRFADREAMER